MNTAQKSDRTSNRNPNGTGNDNRKGSKPAVTPTTDKDLVAIATTLIPEIPVDGGETLVVAPSTAEALAIAEVAHKFLKLVSKRPQGIRPFVALVLARLVANGAAGVTAGKPVKGAMVVDLPKLPQAPAALSAAKIEALAKRWQTFRAAVGDQAEKMPGAILLYTQLVDAAECMPVAFRFWRNGQPPTAPEVKPAKPIGGTSTGRTSVKDAPRSNAPRKGKVKEAPATAAPVVMRKGPGSRRNQQRQRTGAGAKLESWQTA